MNHSLRSLRVTPAFTATAIITLALGIGLATAVFTVADAVLIRRLPIVDQDRVVVLHGESADRGIDNVPLSLENAHDFVRRSRALASGAWFLYNGAAPVTVRDGDRVSRLQRSLVSGDFFAVLGARPLLGRPLRPEDDAAGATPVIVLSYRDWQDRFGGTPGILGRHITTHEDGVSYTVVGVMPPGLDYPLGTDAWVAIRAVMPERTLALMGFDVLGRLTPTGTIGDARNEMTANFRADGRSEWERGVRGDARTLPSLMIGDTRPAILVFAGAAALLLLMTCVNVANLLLVRGLARLREVAIREALGATRRRVIRELLNENCLLAVAGGALGVLIASAAVQAFVAIAPTSLPRVGEIHLNAAALAGSVAITALATLAFAVVPAVMTSNVDVHDILRSGMRHSASRRSRRFMELLVAAQVALSLMVLSAAALIGRSFMKLESADLAFSPTAVTIAELSFRAEDADDGARQAAALERLVPALASIPGVGGVSPVVSVPYASTRSWEGRPSLPGQSRDEAARDPMIDMEVVSPGFFAALGLPVLRGRPFASSDRRESMPVVMLSQSAASAYWPSEDPVGKKVVVGGDRVATVVGIVPDARYRNLREPHATIYYPLAQSEFPFAPNTLVIRSTHAASELVTLVRRVIDETTPDVTLASARPFGELLAAPLAQPRMNAVLLVGFALAALALAGVGLFGVLATMVRQRRAELGIRMALGAAPLDVAMLVLTRGVALATIGTLVGAIGALATNQFLAALLFEVSPTDPASIAVGCVLTIFVALMMSAVPARTSAAIAPAEAMRVEG